MDALSHHRILHRIVNRKEKNDTSVLVSICSSRPVAASIPTARLTFLVLNFCFDVFNGITGLNFQSYCLSGKCLDEDLHFFVG